MEYGGNKKWILKNIRIKKQAIGLFFANKSPALITGRDYYSSGRTLLGFFNPLFYNRDDDYSQETEEESSGEPEVRVIVFFLGKKETD